MHEFEFSRLKWLSYLKMVKMVNFGEFLKIWSLRSNSVTRQVSFYRTKSGGKCQNTKIKMPHFEWFSNTVSSRGDEALRAKNAPLHNNAARPSRSINFAQWQILKKLPKRTTSVQQPFWLLLSNALLGSSFLRKIAQEIANL